MPVNSHPYYPVALPRRKSAQNALNRRLGGPQGQSGQSGVEKKALLNTEIEPIVLGRLVIA